MSAMDLAILAAGTLFYAVFSKRLNDGMVTLPMAFALFGFLVGADGFDLVAFDTGHGSIHLLAELTLALVLFSDAARLDVKELLNGKILALRMLLVGLPLAVLVGGVLALLLFPDVPPMAAFLLAAMLAPTDAALGQAVLTNKDVPLETREVMTAESGLNDGLALPAVVMFAILASASDGPGSSGPAMAQFAVMQIVLGPLSGIIVAYLGGHLIDWAVRSGTVTKELEGVAMLALALLAYALAESIGGNGFLAAFSAGITLGCTVKHRCGALIDFMEEEGQILTAFTFLLFGATLLPDGLAVMGWGTVLYALASLFVVRVVAIMLSFMGSKVDYPGRLFMGWFGPRGLASILFALMIFETYDVPFHAELQACVMLTVAFSIVLHGLSATPLSRLYGRYIRR
ncbi:sodium:proton antiporter [Iodidimonas muriae]|uniref:Sodium:proton antiporter n=1 Tax=Iodidimonas muriae TaxID=261467 RepID=A0ABQ2LD47_9PROT|nr:cation:proton antiporter [Iodidimonas muriae]GGO11410.1 sodium:proton antiporter [Iodidimonas muriae]